MIQTFLFRLLQVLGIVALQVLVFNHINLWGYGTPLIPAAVLLYVPRGAWRVGTLLWAFAAGIVVDVFTGTPGVCSGAMTFTAMLQPAILEQMAPRDADDDILPTYRSMGTWEHTRYIMLLLFVHHLAFYSLELFSLFRLRDMVLYMLSSWAASVVVVMALESFRGRGR